MLFGEHGGRCKHGDLLAVHRGDEGRAHRYFRLAVAGVAADQTVHRFGGGHVPLYGVDRRRLVRSFLVWEGGFECVHAVAGDVVGEARHGLALRLRLQKRGGEVRDGTLRVQLVLLPAPSVQPVQVDLFAAHSDVAGEQVRVGGRDVELAAVGVFDCENLAAHAVHEYLGRADVAPDAVVHVHDVFAWLQVVEVREPCAGRRGGTAFQRAGPSASEDAVGLRHDDKAADLESAGKAVDGEDACAALTGGVEVPFEPPAGVLE